MKYLEVVSISGMKSLYRSIGKSEVETHASPQDTYSVPINGLVDRLTDELLRSVKRLILRAVSKELFGKTPPPRHIEST